MNEQFDLVLTTAQVRTIKELADAEAHEVGLQESEHGVIARFEHDDQRDGRYTTRYLVGKDGGRIELRA